MQIQKNLGGADRMGRAGVGIVLICLVFIGPQTAWGWLGLIPLATAFSGICPAYFPLGLNTCKR
ncbi:hypothetical protein CKO15_01495 [Halorhodospira abdelmalekii]|uniref:YgaP family membrane protein n=1 Tax=Halorhodospira abdelmalekii TaxID=421629 RepID=UPI001903E44C|nr:DUF2892 domain-containing protein [Halorhodospira abdelmalekii]MBK1733975.1 hypothetical protein [Halorhodospira abdelmalekii]